MIQSYVSSLITPVTLTSNSASLQLQTDCIRTNSCNCNNYRSWLCHNQGSVGYDIVEGGLYEINFNASVSSATAGTIAFALFNNGEMIPGTLMAETIAAANDYANIGINKKIKVCCRGNANITVQSVPTVPTPATPATPITTQIPIVVSANLSIARLNG